MARKKVDNSLLEGVKPKWTKVSDEALAEMLKASGGFKTVVAEKLGISCSAVCKRIRNSEMLQDTVETIQNTVLDIAESSTVAAAKRGEAWACCFILKCLGKKRGWIEHTRVETEDVSGKPPIVFNLIPQSEIDKAKSEKEII